MGQRISRMAMIGIATVFCTTTCLASVRTTTFQVTATVMADCRTSVRALATHMVNGRAQPEVRCSANALHAVTVETRLIQSPAAAAGQTVALATITF